MKILVLFLLLTSPIKLWAQSADSLTSLEKELRQRLQQPGVHVVHLWAPWCHNSRDELSKGWAQLIQKNPSIDFIFVTVWNNGKSGRDVLANYGIPEQVPEFIEQNTSSLKRSTHFLGYPLYWTPSTWIFHKNGRLAYALNYGEIDMNLLQQLIDYAVRPW